MTAPDPRLGEIEARLSAATPGPWKAHDTWTGQGGYCATVLSGTGNDIDLRAWLPTFSHEAGMRARNVVPDAEFIANAPADVAYLLAELRKRDAALAAAFKLAEEWRYKGEHGWGAWQEGQGPDPEGYVLDGASADLRAAISDALAGEAS